MLFNLGKIIATQAVLDALGPSEIANLLTRHAKGDWGLLDKHDTRANNRALHEGKRLVSEYLLSGMKVWIITEADRSVTTVLFPREY